jgi:phage shock protein C
MSLQNKRLYRSRVESKLAGVCGGLGDYMDLDPVFVRVIWVVGTCITGFVPGIVAYLLAWLIMPEQPLPVVTPTAPPVVTPEPGNNTSQA